MGQVIHRPKDLNSISILHLGPQVGFQLGDLLNLDLRLWTFGAISSKDDLSDKEFHDGKLTSQHSFLFTFLGASFGKGIEHKIEYRGGNEAFKSSDFRWLDFFFGTTKTDPLGNVLYDLTHVGTYRVRIVVKSQKLSDCGNLATSTWLEFEVE
jgi:hypothetical protein